MFPFRISESKTTTPEFREQQRIKREEQKNKEKNRIEQIFQEEKRREEHDNQERIQRENQEKNQREQQANQERIRRENQANQERIQRENQERIQRENQERIIREQQERNKRETQNNLKLYSEDIKISLCIPTKNRFDNFLSSYLDSYCKYLDNKSVDEIIICDENSSDYDKIVNKYSSYVNNNKNNFRVYKNDRVLGVFLNKLKVCSLANNRFIALIDSDNFPDEDYFINVKNYISKTKLSSHTILAPSKPVPHFDYTQFNGKIITKRNVNDFMSINVFGILLNTGNYVLTKDIINNITYDKDILNKITSCDVIYFNLLCFQQFNDFEMHVLKDVEYKHVVHNDSEYLKTHAYCDSTLEKFVIPSYKKLI